jgi:hypothetical protein
VYKIMRTRDVQSVKETEKLDRGSEQFQISKEATGNVRKEDYIKEL